MFRSSLNQLRCSRAREWVSLALDDQLDEAGRVQLASHLMECEDCRQHQALLERGSAALRSHWAEPSENFEWRVQLGIQRALRDAAVGPQRVAGSFWRPALASAAGVAALVVGLGSFLLLDSNPPQGLADRAPSAVQRPTASTMANLPVDAAVPDLSGAVPGKVFEFDATRDGFGIRTVSRTTADPRFSGDLYETVRDGRQRGNVPDTGAWVRLGGQDTFHWRRITSSGPLRGQGVQVLNLRLRGSTLPTARSESDSSMESMLPVASPR